MLEAIAELGMAAFVSWGYPIGAKHQEEARRRCLTSLVDDLCREGVGELVIEKREDRALNGADRRTILDAQHAGLGST